jgi:tagaturonate reductase
METLNRSNVTDLPVYPERILQFGEGNFLRSFADWMVNRMNKTVGFNSGITVIQPIERGMVEMLNAQDGLYHVCLKGMKNGQPVKETELIDCINRGINPYTDFDAYREVIDHPELRFVISNTTEAGIVFDENDRADMQPQQSFPGKMTALLYQRFKTFEGDPSKGLIIIACELIDRNADFLKKYVLQHAENWKLETEFIDWLEKSCAFCNSLVDRIVPGFPKETIREIQQELGYEDNLVTEGEYFHLWVIEGPEWVQKEFPAQEAGLEVKFVNDMTRYREQKVRVLNGCHTGSFATSLLYGLPTVRESIENLEIGRYMKEMVYDEILVGIPGNREDLEAFATKILERFYNPYIRHEWRSIALNAMSKWETRNLPSLLDYFEKEGRLPQKLVFSLAASIAYYKGNVDGVPYPLNDDQWILDFYREVWQGYDGTPEGMHQLTSKVLSLKRLWKNDLNQVTGLTEAIAGYLYLIEQAGMKVAVKSVLKKKDPEKKVA